MSVSKSNQKLSERYGNGSAGKGRRSGSFAAIVGVVTVLVIALIIGVSMIMSMNTESGKKGDVSSYNLVVTPDNVEQLKEEQSSTVAAGTYDVSMTMDWYFRDARSVSSNAYVENFIGNTNVVKFTIERDDTLDIIYESPYIPVGSSLSNIKLSDETLGKGVYPCTIIYHLVDDDYNEISTVRIALSIEIGAD